MFSRKEAPFKVLVKNFTFLEMGTEKPTAVVQSSEGGKDMSEAGAGLSPPSSAGARPLVLFPSSAW